MKTSAGMMTLFTALLFYLRDHDAEVKKIENLGNTDHYCEFSGEGNLFIKKKGRSSMVVIHDSNKNLSQDSSPIRKNEHLAIWFFGGGEKI